MINGFCNLKAHIQSSVQYTRTTLSAVLVHTTNAKCSMISVFLHFTTFSWKFWNELFWATVHGSRIASVAFGNSKKNLVSNFYFIYSRAVAFEFEFELPKCTQASLLSSAFVNIKISHVGYKKLYSLGEKLAQW